MIAAAAPAESLRPPRAALLRKGRSHDQRTTALLLVAIDAFAMTAAIARFGHLTINTFLLVGLAISLVAASDHYRPRIHLSILDDMASIGGRVVIAVSLGAAYRELVSGHDVFTVDRLWVLIGAAGFVLAGRSMAYVLLRRLRGWGRLQRRTVVIGSAETGTEVNEAILMNPAYGLVPVDEPRQFPIPEEMLCRSSVDVVIAEVTDSNDKEVSELIRTRNESSPDMYLLPSALMRYPAVVPGADQLSSIPLLPLRTAVHRSLRWRLKRVLDIAIATPMLVVSMPIMLLCAAVLRFEGGPGVLFRQERIGLGGRRFTMLKLRTIVDHGSAPEHRSSSHIAVATDGGGPDRAGDIVWNVRREGIPPFGRFCRETSLDELPQLWNIIRGDMSLVGPRPERPHFAAQFSQSVPDYESRHRVPGGLTGLAQIHGLRGDTSIRLRARFDNSYIDNWSLVQDLKILARTAAALFTTRGRGS